MRGGTYGLWAAPLLAACFAGAAPACTSCTPDNTCLQGPRGALMCLGDGFVCSQAGRCVLGGIGSISDYGVVGVTLVEDGGTGPAVRPVAVRGAAAVGREAARLAADAAGGAGGVPEVLWSRSGYFGEGTVIFRAREGDGFALTRAADGRGARLTVRALAGGRPGRVLACERTGEDEALVVRVAFGGRARRLVIATATLPEPEAAARHAEAVRALAAEGNAAAALAPAPFELAVE